jgi:archaellum component FlaG (FlaF/FlaG flagellin family)
MSSSSSSRAALVLAIVAVATAALVAAGCGETVIDSAKTEAALEQNLRKSLHEQVSSVECPSDVKVEAGATFECTVKQAGGKEETATLKIVNKEADVEVTGLSPKK